jgi:hypothetical protein
MVGQLLSNTNEMLQCILSLQNLDLNTAGILIQKRTLHLTFIYESEGVPNSVKNQGRYSFRFLPGKKFS